MRSSLRALVVIVNVAVLLGISLVPDPATDIIVALLLAGIDAAVLLSIKESR